MSDALARVKAHIAAAEAMGALTMDIRPPNTGPMIADLKALVALAEADAACRADERRKTMLEAIELARNVQDYTRAELIDRLRALADQPPTT